MKKHLAAFAAAFAFTGIPAFAQAAPEPDPAAVQATRQMLDAMHAHDMMAQTLKAIEQTMPVQMRASLAGTLEQNKNLSAQQKAEALDRFDKNLPAMTARTHALFDDPTLIDELISAMVPLYASAFTIDELHQLTAFYASPVGQKSLATTPKLMGQAMAISGRIVQARVAKAMAAGASPTNGQ